MAKEVKRKNKTPEELKAELRQKTLQTFLEDIEEVNVKHKMRLVPVLQATKSKIECLFEVEDIVEVEYKKADDKTNKSEDVESTDSDDKGAEGEGS